jgi:predicted Fe-S protein YdhL (DUF1289 family)
MITDERLAELIKWNESSARGKAWLEEDDSEPADTAAALRELQQRREEDHIASMSDERRLGYFEYLESRYCRGCGRTQPEPPARRCQCWNDA